MYTDYESLFERYSIMSVDAHMEDQQILRILEKQTSLDVFAKLVNFCLNYKKN